MQFTLSNTTCLWRKINHICEKWDNTVLRIHTDTKKTYEVGGFPCSQEARTASIKAIPAYMNP